MAICITLFPPCPVRNISLQLFSGYPAVGKNADKKLKVIRFRARRIRITPLV